MHSSSDNLAEFYRCKLDAVIGCSTFDAATRRNYGFWILNNVLSGRRKVLIIGHKRTKHFFHFLVFTFVEWITQYITNRVSVFICEKYIFFSKKLIRGIPRERMTDTVWPSGHSFLTFSHFPSFCVGASASPFLTSSRPTY